MAAEDGMSEVLTRHCNVEPRAFLSGCGLHRRGSLLKFGKLFSKAVNEDKHSGIYANIIGA